MKWCANCGTQMSDDAAFCGNCGTPAPQQQPPVQNAYIPEQPVYTAPQPTYDNPTYVEPPVTTPSADVPSGGLNFLAFMFPIVGLILFLSMKSSTPVKAKSIGKWALIGGILQVVAVTFVIFLVIVIAILASM